MVRKDGPDVGGTSPRMFLQTKSICYSEVRAFANEALHTYKSKDRQAKDREDQADRQARTGRQEET